MGNGSSHDRGYAGEQSMGFFLGERGYFFVEGPIGAAGHGITSRGFDGVAYNPKTRHLIIYDNKAWATGSVDRASAIDPNKNLSQNLDRLIQRVNGITNLPQRTEILDLLRRTRNAIQIGRNWPRNVQIAVSNSSGQSTGVSQRLSRSGIQFIVYNQSLHPPRLSQRRYMDAAALFGSLLGSLAQWVGDIGIQREIRNRLENELVQGVISILMRGEGVLVIIQLQEWETPDIQGRHGKGLPSKQLNRLGSVPHIFSKDLHVVGVSLRTMVGFLLETSKRYRNEAIVARRYTTGEFAFHNV